MRWHYEGVGWSILSTVIWAAWFATTIFTAWTETLVGDAEGAFWLGFCGGIAFLAGLDWPISVYLKWINGGPK